MPCTLCPMWHKACQHGSASPVRAPWRLLRSSCSGPLNPEAPSRDACGTVVPASPLLGPLAVTRTDCIALSETRQKQVKVPARVKGGVCLRLGRRQAPRLRRHVASAQCAAVRPTNVAAATRCSCAVSSRVVAPTASGFYRVSLSRRALPVRWSPRLASQRLRSPIAAQRGGCRGKN